MNKHISSVNDKETIINDNKLIEMVFKIHKWIVIEAENNEIELSFLSGISNTLSKGNLGGVFVKLSEK